MKTNRLNLSALFTFFVFLLFASKFSLTAEPRVANVIASQVGDKLEIQYDILSLPEGVESTNIDVFFSEDGTEESYSQVYAISGDIHPGIANGHTIIWDITKDWLGEFTSSGRIRVVVENCGNSFPTDDVDAEAYITQIESLGGALTNGEKEGIRRFYLSVKLTENEAGSKIWDQMHAIYLPIWGSRVSGVEAQEIMNGINLKKPGVFFPEPSDNYLEFHGSVNHLDGYIQGDGETGYANIPSITPDQLTSEKPYISYSVFIKDFDSTKMGQFIGAGDGTRGIFYGSSSYSTGQPYTGRPMRDLELEDNSLVIAYSTPNFDLSYERISLMFHFGRLNQFLFGENTNWIEGSQFDNSNYTNTFYLMANNTGSGASDFSNAKIRFAHIGVDLTINQVSIFTDAVHELLSNF